MHCSPAEIRKLQAIAGDCHGGGDGGGDDDIKEDDDKVDPEEYKRWDTDAETYDFFSKVPGLKIPKMTKVASNVILASSDKVVL
jgi:hypothetical protein